MKEMFREEIFASDMDKNNAEDIKVSEKIIYQE